MLLEQAQVKNSDDCVIYLTCTYYDLELHQARWYSRCIK